MDIYASSLLWLPALLIANSIEQAFFYGIAVGVLHAVEYNLNQYCERIELEAAKREIDNNASS